jgi:ATP-dependent helicase HrpA
VIANEINQTVVETFDLYAKVTAALKANKISDTSVFFQNIKSHLSHLMPPNFISITPHAHLIHFPRYLEALRFRIEKMRSDPQRDQSWQQQISEYLSKLDAAINVTASESQRNQLVEVKWSIEELRVSLWAQQIKTLYPISFKRIERAMAEAMKT